MGDILSPSTKDLSPELSTRPPPKGLPDKKSPEHLAPVTTRERSSPCTRPATTFTPSSKTVSAGPSARLRETPGASRPVVVTQVPGTTESPLTSAIMNPEMPRG